MKLFKNALETLEFFRRRAGAYRTVFRGNGGSDVLADLGKFCCARESCVVIGDQHQTWLNEGKRLVWLRIEHHLNLNPQELAALYGAIAHTQE